MKKLITLIILAFGAIQFSAQSNDILISIIIPQPHSPYIFDYNGLLNQQILTLTNTTSEEKHIKLSGSIVGNNGLEAHTNDNYLPSQAIILAPFGSMTLTANSSNLDYLSENNIDYSGDNNVINSIIQTGIIPEGIYTICIEARDYFTNETISPTAPAGCQTLFISYVSPPVLFTPICNDTLNSITNPFPSFSWLPISGNAGTSQIVYDLYIAKILPGQDPNDAMRAAIDYGAGDVNIIHDIPITNYTYLPSDIALETQQHYVYAVVARDLSYTSHLINNGESNFCTFYYGYEESDEDPFDVLSNTDLILDPDFNFFDFQFYPTTTISGTLKYKFKDPTEGNFTGTTLASNLPWSTMDLSVGNFGVSSNESSDNGFSGSTYEMGNIDFSSVDYFGITQNNSGNSGNTEMPQTWFEDHIPSTNSKALDNISIEAYVVYMTSSVPNPQKPEHVIEIPYVPDSFFDNSEATSENFEFLGPHALGITTTSSNGEFTLTFPQDINCGIILSTDQQLDIQQLPMIAEITAGGQIIYEAAESISGYGLYRGIRLRVVNPHYCSPDLVMFPQPGDQVQLSDQISFVNSYNLEVTVKEKNSANDNLDNASQIPEKSIPGSLVRIGRPHEEMNYLPSFIPTNELRREEFGELLPVHAGNSQTNSNFVLMDEYESDIHGKVTLHNLVKHSRNNSLFYYLEAGTDEFQGEYNFLIRGMINNPYMVDELYPSNILVENFFGTHHLKNSDFELRTYPLEISLSPSFPEIYLQTVSEANDEQQIEAPLPHCTVNLINNHSYGGSSVIEYETDDEGFLKMKYLYLEYNPNTLQVNGPSRMVLIGKSGYKLSLQGPLEGKVLQQGERWNIGKVVMEPLGKVIGEIVNEEGEAVMAEVRIGESPYISTTLEAGNPYGLVNIFTGEVIPDNDAATFSLNAPSGQAIPVEIIPMSEQYFTQIYTRDIQWQNDGSIQDLGELMVYEKLHRIDVSVYKDSGFFNNQTLNFQTIQVPVTGAEVRLGNQAMMLTNQEGVASFKFASPDSEFRIRINKDAAYTVIDEYLEIPISKETLIKNYILDAGQSITGTVTNTTSNQAEADVRVFCEVGQNDYGPVIVETYSDESGNFTLQGVQFPEVSSSSVIVKCSKSGSDQTYIGSEKEVLYSDLSQGVDLEIYEADFELNTIWGYPVEISKIREENGAQFISGSITEIPSNNRFVTEDDSNSLNFKEVEIEMTTAENPQATPVEESITLENQQMRIVLNDAFLVTLNAPQLNGLSFYTSSSNNQRGLVWRKNQESFGTIRGKAISELEYFNFSYQYDGVFCLGEAASHTTIDAFHSNDDHAFPESYYLTDLNALGLAKDLEFKVHDFEASAPRDKSFVRNDSIFLAAQLHVHLPNSQPEELNIDAGFIRITPNDIDFSESGDELTIHLEEWDLTGTSWAYNNNLGGLSSQNMQLRTNTLNFDIPEVIIKPDRLIIPESNTVSSDGLNIANVTPLHLNPDSKFIFQHMESSPHDQQSHWMIKIFNPNDLDAAYLSELPSLDENISIEHIYNYSDGEFNLSLPDNQEITYHNILKQNLENIEVLNNGFYFSGTVRPEIVGAQSGFNGKFMFTKNNGIVAMTVQDLNIDVSTTGYVDFDGDDIPGRAQLEPGILTVYGNTIIRDPSSSNEITLRTKLIKTNETINLQIFDTDQNNAMDGNVVQEIALGGGSAVQKVLEGGSSVLNNQWKPFKYRMEFEGFGNSFDASKDNSLWMIVDGAIHTSDDDDGKINLTNIDTPFGDMHLSYLFNEQALVGDMQISNVPLGAVYINSGTANMRVGGLGFYIAASVDATYPVIADVTSNLIIGSYPHIPLETQALLLTDMHIQALPAFLQNGGISGMYMAANKTILHRTLDIDLGIAQSSIYANAGFDTRFWLNFSEDFGDCHIGAMAYADLELYQSVFEVCEMCVGLKAELGAFTNYQWNPDEGFSINSCGSLNAYANFCGVSVDKTLSVDAIWNTSNNDIDISISDGDCSGNSEDINSYSTGCVHN